MAAYSAVVSLEELLNQLLNSDQFPKEEVVALHEKISSLKSSLENIFPAPKEDRDKANELAIRIREQIFEVQDTIESFIFFTQNHLPAESPESPKGQSWTSISLQEIAAGIDPIISEAKELSVAINDVPGYSQSVSDFMNYNSSVFGQKNKIIGQDEYKRLIEEKLLAETGSRLVIPICGMPGIGKTALAKSIYEDVSFMKTNFPYKAWVTVSEDASVHDILGKLLNTLESRGQKAGDKKYEGDEAKLRVELHQALSNHKYLVVIDDLWDTDFWMRLRLALPDNENKSRILLTTRITDVAKFVNEDFRLEMEPLSYIDSWRLLRNRTFGDDKACPIALEYYGRRIAENCKGFPLSLIIIGGLLSQGSREPKYWESIEEDTKANTYGAKSYTGILSLSYDLLPCKLKPCFLYMAAFPRDCIIPVSKLIMLWVAEGFLTIHRPRLVDKEPPPPQRIEEVVWLSLEETKPKPPRLQLIEEAAENSLQGLIDRNLFVIHRIGSDGRIKSCGMHNNIRDLAEEEAEKDKFFHLRKKHDQKLEQDTNPPMRISVHNNILMCLEDVYNSTKLITNARSLLFTGVHHHHPIPFTLPFDLLRVLDAFTVFFIEFPDEILELIHLRYLSFTYNGKLPSRLSLLQKLQVLVVQRKPKFIYVGIPFLPDEIWMLKELRHLLMTETDLPVLPDTEPGTILFENLQTLFHVNAESCGQEVLDHMPNLTRLKMWREGPKKVPYYMNKLDKLEIFKFTVLNPIMRLIPEAQPKFYFPNTVRKLNLSGTGLPWEDMEAIAALPNLEVLKLKEFAFHGDEWCPTNVFRRLKFLLIEYLKLKRWVVNCSTFPVLERLILKHCYELEELPEAEDFLSAKNLRLLELVHCSPDAVAWAECVETTAEDYGHEVLRVFIYPMRIEYSP